MQAAKMDIPQVRRRARWNTCQCVNADKEAHQGKIKSSQVSRMTKRSHVKRRVTPVRVPCLQLASSTFRVVPPCDLGQHKLDNLNERHLHTTQEASKAAYFPANSPRLRTAQDLSLVSVFLEADGNASEQPMVGSGLVLGLSPSMNSISSRLGVTNLKRNER